MPDECYGGLFHDAVPLAPVPVPGFSAAPIRCKRDATLFAEALSLGRERVKTEGEARGKVTGGV